MKSCHLPALLALGLLPAYVLLEGLNDRGLAVDAERRWIQRYLPSGLLLNQTALLPVSDRYAEAAARAAAGIRTGKARPRRRPTND